MNMTTFCAIRGVGGRAHTMATIDGLWVCVDCALYIANGDVPEYGTDAENAQRLREIEAGMEQEGYEWCLGDDTEASFSWRRCDCCGSGLGGDRHSAVLYKPCKRTQPEA